MGELNPTRSVYSVIGNLCKNPMLLRDLEFTLQKEDFEQEFHQRVFAAINNIAESDYRITKITPIDIDNYLANYPSTYKIWEKHNGFNYVASAIEDSNPKTFRSDYDRLKKFSLLRDFEDNGVSVSSVYDYKNVNVLAEEKAMKKLDKMSLEKVAENLLLNVWELRDKWLIGEGKQSFEAGDGLDELLVKFDQEPEFGTPFQNEMFNALFRGARGSKLFLRSAGTGGGKTRQAIADMCITACRDIYDLKRKCWVDTGFEQPALLISTELEKEELQTCMLAFISGISEDIIKKGHYNTEVSERLKRAIVSLKRAQIYSVYIPDFSINDIESIIEQHIRNYGVTHIFFDYIQITPKLSRTMNQAFEGMPLREDQILAQLSSSLKLLANKFDVFIATSTQLNRTAKEMENRDATAIRGSVAVADKVDYGIISYRVTQKDLTNIKHVIEGLDRTPNFMHVIYKNRGGRSAVIIWTKFDMGNVREEVLFTTDLDYNPVRIHEIKKVEFKPIIDAEIINDGFVKEEVIDSCFLDMEYEEGEIPSF